MMNLDYTPLEKPITKQDIREYKNYPNAPKLGSTTAVVFGVVMLLFFTVMAAIDIMQGNPIGYPMFLVFAVSLLFAMIYLNWKKNNTTLLVKQHKFAIANNLKVFTKWRDPPYDGAIFNYGTNKIVNRAIQFPDDTVMGSYQYSVITASGSKVYFWGFIKVKLNRRLPHMLLDSKSNETFLKLSFLPNLPKNNQILKLEGDFNKYFTLYVPQNYQRDALYIFTPDVMAALVDMGLDYDIEIIDDNLMIYHPDGISIDSAEFIKKALTLVDKLGKELHDQTKRYVDTKSNDNSPDTISETGQRLKQSRQLKIALSILWLLITLTSTLTYIGLTNFLK